MLNGQYQPLKCVQNYLKEEKSVKKTIVNIEMKFFKSIYIEHFYLPLTNSQNNSVKTFLSLK